MTPASKPTHQPATSVLSPPSDQRDALPIWLVREDRLEEDLAALSGEQRLWLTAIGFKGGARKHALVPGPAGNLAGVVLGVGKADAVSSFEPAPVLLGLLPPLLPRGSYRLASPVADGCLAGVAWGMGAYRFQRYRSNATDAAASLRLEAEADHAKAANIVEAVWLGRDLINTPANDMGPAELEDATRSLGEKHGAEVEAVAGDVLLERGYGLIHAVGKASPRAPRLIELTWGRSDAPKVTLVGKGICFDTGGLDIKPASGMLLMKKDMGGAATALALAHMIMGQKLDVRLRVVIAAAENSIAGNAFRPGDVIRSRSGKTVEIGNTDAEGRLVLADALTLADQDAPDYLMTFATLTGAARIALGPELMPFYCDDDAFAASIAAAGAAVGDPVWRMPLTTPYESWLDSPVADMNNVAEGGFAGSIVGAIFLKRFVERARRFAHFDIYGWRPSAKPLGPKGGEVNAARAVFETLVRGAGSSG